MLTVIGYSSKPLALLERHMLRILRTNLCIQYGYRN
jgi:hypothetical protein